MGKIQLYIYKITWKDGIDYIRRYKLVTYNPAENYIEYEDENHIIVKIDARWLDVTVFFRLKDVKQYLHDYGNPKVRIYKCHDNLYIGINKFKDKTYDLRAA